MTDVHYENHYSYTKDKPYIIHESQRGGNIPHWHENVEILLYREMGEIYCNNEMYELAPGDIAVINSNVIHRMPGQKEPFYDCLIVDREFCMDNGIDLSCISLDVIIKDEKAQMLYEAVLKEYSSEDRLRDVAVRAAILTFVVYLCRGFSREESFSGNSAVKKAIGFMYSKIGEKLSVDEIASFSAMSSSHFCRLFRKETGYSVIEYQNLIRCTKAEKLIREKRYTVNEAAVECGFGNASYFSRTFKKVMGYLPASCRKE